MRQNLNRIQGKKDEAIAEESEYEDDCGGHNHDNALAGGDSSPTLK